MGNKQTLEDEVFNLKFLAKSLNRESKKCEKENKSQLKKVKKALEQKNHEVARIHAENAIRQKNQSLNFLKMSSRMDAIAQRLQSTDKMQKLNKSMVNVTRIMRDAIERMDIEKLTKTMDEFERNVEDLDIQSNVMEDAIQQTTGQVTPEDQVINLLKQASDEVGIAFEENLANVPMQQKVVNQDLEDDELQKKFDDLKSK